MRDVKCPSPEKEEMPELTDRIKKSEWDADARTAPALMYTAAGQMPKLLPLAHWTSCDVMAYMLHHDLPLLRAYTDSDDPERARSEMAFGVIGASAADALRRHGVWDEWRRIYPELWRDWQLRWFSGADSTAVMKSAA